MVHLEAEKGWSQHTVFVGYGFCPNSEKLEILLQAQCFCTFADELIGNDYRPGSPAIVKQLAKCNY
jgi:hypothetical protein